MQTASATLPAHQQPLPHAVHRDDLRHARTLPSTDLLQGGRSVEISHNGSVYRLQTTKLGKLILTK